jgi:heme/copper-type cytochrome/quinol oxidase subunit 3
MEASAPTGLYIEPEPREWQPRAMWAGARLLSGAAAFFFMAFVLAYFYLRSLDVHHAWTIGAVDPPVGLGVAIAAVLVASAVLLRVAGAQPRRTVSLGLASLGLALLALVLQVIEWFTLSFGGANGGYASVFIGWTVLYAVLALGSIYWIETQVAAAWRARRGESDPAHPAGAQMMSAEIEACSFFWTFYVGIGVLAFVILYLI